MCIYLVDIYFCEDCKDCKDCEDCEDCKDCEESSAGTICSDISESIFSIGIFARNIKTINIQAAINNVTPKIVIYIR